MHQEKRVHPRVAVSLMARCQIGSTFSRDAVADLSRGGLYLRTRKPAREGTAVRVALALPHESGPKFCTLVGSVARVERDPRGKLLGIGVTFDPTQTPLRDHSTLLGYIAATH